MFTLLICTNFVKKLMSNRKIARSKNIERAVFGQASAVTARKLTLNVKSVKKFLEI